MQKKISVIVPVYNIEGYIERCLKSIQKQTYPRFEVIIIDDGSTDNSLLLCQKFAKKYRNFRVISQKNQGLSAARNAGIKQATGDFLAFVDGDDEILPNFLADLMTAAEATDAEIAICGFFEVYPKNTRIVNIKSRQSMTVKTGREAVKDLLIFQKNIEIVTWNKLYKKEIFNKVQFPVGKICEDNLTTYKLLARAKKVVYLDLALYRYFRRNNSITKQTNQLVFCERREEAAEAAVRFFQNSGETETEAAKYSLLLAYFKYLDFALSGRIEKKYFRIYRQKILERRAEFLRLKCLDGKRKLYLNLIGSLYGLPYIWLRKIKNERLVK